MLVEKEGKSNKKNIFVTPKCYAATHNLLPSMECNCTWLQLKLVIGLQTVHNRWNRFDALKIEIQNFWTYMDRDNVKIAVVRTLLKLH